MKTHQQYPPNQSIFYRLRNKSKLAKLFSLAPKELIALSKQPTYSSFIKETPGKKSRLIEQPVGQLEGVHKRVQTLLSRVETPSYEVYPIDWTVLDES